MDMSTNKPRRLTKQRRLVRDAVIKRLDHPTAKEIYHELKPTGIGIATVYRHLSSMVEDGVLRIFDYDNETRYDPLTSPHAHLICSICNEISDIELPNNMNNLAPEKLGFEINKIELTWMGICDACKS
jgi:Fe2+ or Zn2+ uptake regulation protein